MQNNSSKPAKPSPVRPLVFLLLLVGIIFMVRYFHLDQYLEKERLREMIAAHGLWGPTIYMLLWLAAPPLFLPGLPIGLARGVLFGPFGGVVLGIILVVLVGLIPVFYKKLKARRTTLNLDDFQ